MSDKTRYTQDQIEAVRVQLENRIASEKERVPAGHALAELVEQVRQMRDVGMTRKQVAEALRDAGMPVSNEALSGVWSANGPQTARPKRHYRPRKGAATDPISPPADTSNEPEE